jgi:hypothetical protein
MRKSDAGVTRRGPWTGRFAWASCRKALSATELQTRLALDRWAPWSVIDQVLWSASNFALVWAAGRALPTSQFGAFAILYSLFVLVQGVFRSWFHEPKVLVFARGHASTPPHPTLVGAPIAIATALSLGLAAAYAIALRGSVRLAAVAFALSLPFALLQDSVRHHCIARSDMRSASIVDAVWTLPFLAVALPLAVRDRFSDDGGLAILILLWGCTAGVSAAVGARRTRTVREPEPPPWVVSKDSRDSMTNRLEGGSSSASLRVPHTVEFFTTYVGSQGLVPILGLVGTLAVAGQFRSAQLLFAPALSLAAGLALAGVPTAAQCARLRGRRPAAAYATRLALVMGSFIVLWALLLLTLGPRYGAALFGNAYAAGSEVLAPMAAIATGSTIVIGLSVGVRAVCLPKAAVAIRLTTLVGVLAGALVYAPRGTLAVTTFVGFVWFSSVAVWAIVLWSRRWNVPL